jgi:alkanesulfonate monooxygenase SsuD/methylene tetrahydromethanopterin reductase-like flavin-dependent oxidoreductase (luciferase family)
MMTKPALGVMLRRELPPEQVVDYARRVEAAGFDTLWIVEDCFFAGGISTVTLALARTERILVGLGITPAVARNPAFSAMEFAALARYFPGRFLAGIGHGVAAWMQQIGALPPSQLAALGETTAAVRALLRGERLTTSGRYVRLSEVELEHKPGLVPPVYLGVRGPKSLMLAGRVADGTILCEPSPPDYIQWARAQIAQGAAEASRSEPHPITIYAFCAVDSDGAAARQRMRPVIAGLLSFPEIHAQIAPLGIADEVAALLRAGGQAHLSAHMPTAWLNALAIAGTPDECAATVMRLGAAGADSVVLVPPLDPDYDPLPEFARAIKAL